MSILDYIFVNRLESKEPKLKKGFRVNWRKTNIETLEIFYQGAKDRVSDTVNDHNEISKKFFSLLVLVLSIASALCVFLFNDVQNSFRLKVIAFVAMIVLTFVISIISQMIRPIKFRARGREPFKAISPKVFENKVVENQEDLVKYTLYTELLNCQAKIELNQFYNNKRLDAMDFIIRLLLLSFVVLAFLSFILETI